MRIKWWHALPLVACFFIASCQKPVSPPEAAFNALITAIEEKDLEGAEKHLDPDFSEEEDRSVLLQWARSWFSQSDNLKVNVLSQEVSDRGSRATLRTTLSVSSGSRVFPTRVRRVYVETEWVKRKEGWRLIVAQWRRV